MHDEIEFGHDEDALAAQTHRGDPLHFRVARYRASQPPLLAIEEQPAEIADRLKARPDRLLDPFRRDDLPAVPGAAIEHRAGRSSRHRADECGGRRRRRSFRSSVVHPFRSRKSPSGCEQRLARERFQRFARHALDDAAEQVRPAAIIGPHRVGRRGDRLRQDVAERIGFAAEMRFVVSRVVPAAVLVPLHAR